MTPLCMSLDEVNKLPSEQFIKIFGNTVEHCPAAAICILKNRPFHNVDAISEAIDNYLDSLPDQELISIVKRHPDLSGKLADMGKLSQDSTAEQSSEGLLNLQPEDKHNITSLNEKYKSRFGFPFVTCVRASNGIYDIIQQMQQRLCNDADTEIDAAIVEVKKISKLRVRALVKEQ